MKLLFSDLSYIFRHLQQIRLIISDYSGDAAKKSQYIYLNNTRFLLAVNFFSLFRLFGFTKTNSPGLIICPVTCLSYALNRLKVNNYLGEWSLVFSTPYLEVWEHCSIRKNNFRLTEVDKKVLLKLARRVALDKSKLDDGDLGNYLSVWQSDQTLDVVTLQKLLRIVSVDVIVWVDGKLRGSQITEGKGCLLAVAESVLRAIEDPRFKPVSLYEIESMRIEIVLINDLAVPLANFEVIKNEIYAEKAYLAKNSDNNSVRGFYVPTVYNCRVFQNLEQLLTSLEAEKVGSKCKFFLCEVIDFIEGNSKDEVLSLHSSVQSTENKNISLIEGVSFAVCPLVNSQEADGNFPSITSPFTVETYPPHWVRSSFLVAALAEINIKFTEYEGRDACIDATHKGFIYLSNYLYKHRSLSNRVRCASLIEYNKAARLLGVEPEINNSHEFILSLVPKLIYEPILFTRVATYLLVNCGLNNVAETFIDAITSDYYFKLKTSQSNIDIATFAELPNLLTLYSKLSNDIKFEQNSSEITKWLLEQQMSNGSFKITPGSNYAYTRGTAKIIESLLTNGFSKDSLEIKKAIDWLHSMQFTENSSYFVRPEISKKILGSFRHDYHNANSWIDASAHYLQILSRLKKD